MEIYNREVLETTHTFDLVPRTIEQQVTYIQDRSGGLAVIVATTSRAPDEQAPDEQALDKGVVGFGSLSFYRDRPGYRTSVENSVYVHHQHRGRGAGDLLIGGLIDRARAHGFHAMFARIADAQETSVQLHTKHGFRLVGIEKEVGRKFGQFRDVALMQLLLDGPAVR